MGQLTLPEQGIVCLDSDTVIYLIEKIQPYVELLLPLLQSVKAGSLQLAGSELLLLETLVKPVEQRNAALESDFRLFLTASRDMRLIPITRMVLERALQLRATYRIRTPDAIHAAAAMLANCTLFVTNDPVYRRVQLLPAVVLDDFI